MNHDDDYEVWMNLALWVIAIVLAVAFAASGLMKIFRAQQQLVASGFGWA